MIVALGKHETLEKKKATINLKGTARLGTSVEFQQLHGKAVISSVYCVYSEAENTRLPQGFNRFDRLLKMGIDGGAVLASGLTSVLL